jgi:uncharacterized protein (TIGR00730 family)
MSTIENVCVYCGSALGHSSRHAETAQAFGSALAARKVGLVYGGGAAGLMGTVARAVKAGGGRVIGVIPEFLIPKEGTSLAIDERIVVPDMHTRKRLMFERADAFVALPGGIGTLEELVEMLTWVQLGRHSKPVLIANIDGFWDPLLALLEHMTTEGFLSTAFVVRYLVARQVEEILPMLEAAAPPGPRPDAVPIDKM